MWRNKDAKTCASLTVCMPSLLLPCRYVYSLVWSHENDALLSCSSDGTAKVWELQHYSKVTRAIRPNVLRHASFVYAAEFHPNQKSHPFIVTAGYDGLIHLWDRASGQKIVSTKVRSIEQSVLIASAALRNACTAQQRLGSDAPVIVYNVRTLYVMYTSVCAPATPSPIPAPCLPLYSPARTLPDSLLLTPFPP